MESKVIEHYSKLALPIDKIISRRPRGVSADHVKEAARLVMDRMVAGEKIKQSRIVRVIWAEAKNLAANDFVSKEPDLAKIKQQLTISTADIGQISAIASNNAEAIRVLQGKGKTTDEVLRKLNSRCMWLGITQIIIIISAYIVWRFLS